MSKLIAVDLFCGCGGISVGLKKAGFNVIAGIDIEKKYLVSFKHNFPEAKALNTDITQVAASEFMKELGIDKGELDLLVGGPPCQGFSKNVPRKYRYLEDPKNLLVKSFLDYCEALQPKMILMENVAEMKNGFDQVYSDELIIRLEEQGYTITSAVLNSADYGVPQRRRRAFFLANRVGVKFKVPVPTHIKINNHKNEVTEIKSLFESLKHVSVWGAISDLPRLAHGKGDDITNYLSAPKSTFQELMRGKQYSVKNHIARKLAPMQYERLSSISPGEGHNDLPEHLKTKGGYSGAYGRLTWDMVAPTITRWVFHPGSGRWGHPEDIRTLTIREAARIQSFPDDYEFLGSYNDQAGQIGNAVPPLLANVVVNSMCSQLGIFSSSTNLSQSALVESNLKAIA